MCACIVAILHPMVYFLAFFSKWTTLLRDPVQVPSSAFARVTFPARNNTSPRVPELKHLSKGPVAVWASTSELGHRLGEHHHLASKCTHLRWCCPPGQSRWSPGGLNIPPGLSNWASRWVRASTGFPTRFVFVLCRVATRFFEKPPASPQLLSASCRRQRVWVARAEHTEHNQTSQCCRVTTSH